MKKLLILLLSITLIFNMGCYEQVEEEQPIILVIEEEYSQPMIVEEEKIETIEEENSIRDIDPMVYIFPAHKIEPQPRMELMEWADAGMAEESSKTEEEYYEEEAEEEIIEEEPEPEPVEENSEEIIVEPRSVEESSEEIIIEPEPVEEESIIEEESVVEPVEESSEASVEVGEEAPAAEEPYWAARYIWDYFHSLGYNDYVVAGLLGNMMCECAHQNLDLQPEIYGDGYYGICQWSSGYTDIWGTSLEYQCQFLANTIQYEMDTYGCGYEYFCSLQNEQDAAIEFASGYERCGSGSYWLRAECATEALEYFR